MKNYTLKKGKKLDSNIRITQSKTWSEIELACFKQLSSLDHSKNNFLLIDVDRTLLLPRGLCDASFNAVEYTAFVRYIQGFRLDRFLSNPAIGEIWDEARKFLPYADKSSAFYSDEDARAIGGLLIATELITNETAVGTSLTAWIDRAISNLNDFGENGWNRNKIHSQLIDIQIGLAHNDCTLCSAFREQEENVMLEQLERGQCALNGHIVRLVKASLERGIIPIAYSDRPGASVGLSLRSYYRSRPNALKPSLIETPLPLVFES